MSHRPWITSLLFVLAIVGLAGGLTGCHTAPITGRRQLLVISEPAELQMGLSAYQEVQRTERPSSNALAAEMVQRVGQRIAGVSGRPDYQWEFRLFASPEQNAFCLPGGKVAVYEGILPVCQNEAGLAVVMAHEVAHALARHGGERMSQRYVIDGTQSLGSYVIQGRWPEQHAAIMKAYGLGTQYGIVLPYSRSHESEADHIGLLLMARAGYDPSEAPRFWSRFAHSHGAAQPPEFLSTHPNDEHRAEALTKLLPEASQLYLATSARFGLGDPIPGVAAVAAQSSGPRVANGPELR
ncbi:MAG: M48 family metallopeptidase [Planctomycetes bacterium]|nr:M48 family metallopeptidase [Planctomycetota bacterium]